MKLSDVRKNQIVKVNSIHTVPDALRCMVLGLTEGTIVECLTRTSKTIELKLHGCSFAISTDVAQHFTVE